MSQVKEESQEDKPPPTPPAAEEKPPSTPSAEKEPPSTASAEKEPPPVLKRSTSEEIVSDRRSKEEPPRPLSHVESEPVLAPKPSAQTEMKRPMSESNLSDSRSQDSPRPQPSPLATPGRAKEEAEKTPSLTESMKRVFMWTMTGFFDFNPAYLVQMRGILNIIHLILSLVLIILLSTICRLSSYVDGRDDDAFICKPPETFLFVVSCGAFFSSTLYFFCCLLSRKTDALMFETSFEVSYFVLYFILFLTASITLMISALTWGPDRHGKVYGTTQTTAVIGLVISIMYGMSAICFFISHRYYRDSRENFMAP